MTNIILAVTTAYCSCFHCCPVSSKGLCANGKLPKEGRTIAASRSIPLGSSVIIKDHEYIVEDRLAKKYDSRFDIYFASHKDALRYGKRTNTVTIITK